MWIQSVINSISNIDRNNKGLSEEVSEFDPNQNWSEKQWKDFNIVTSAIVEPFSSEEDGEDYYEETEKNGFGMVKNNLPNFNNKEIWVKIIDLVEKVGY